MRTVLVCFLLAFATTAQAQFLPGQFEIMLNGTVGSVSESTSYPSPSGAEVNADDSHSYAYIALTPGYYLFRGVSVELELGLRAIEGGPPAQSVLGNLSYTHAFRTSPVALFARAGGGLSNGISLPTFVDHIRYTEGFDVSVLQAGAGIKIRTGRTGIIRVELLYRHQQYELDYFLTTVDHNINTIALMFGVGLLL
ncbi:hypothetical protein KQI65_10840 [bacterium]|nr:hypothetical protein [bacterium]